MYQPYFVTSHLFNKYYITPKCTRGNNFICITNIYHTTKIPEVIILLLHIYLINTISRHNVPEVIILFVSQYISDWDCVCVRVREWCVCGRWDG